MATSKEWFPLINSSGQLVSGATITVRAVGGSTTLFTFSEPDTINRPGQYVLVADTGLYDVYINGVFASWLSPWLHIDSAELPVPVAGSTDLFGDGTDGTYTLDGTQGTVAGVFTRDSGVQYTLNRDCFFQALTLNVGVTLRTNGYRLFVKATFTCNGTVDNSGGAGGAGNPGVGTVGGNGGTAGSAALSNFYQAPRPGIAGSKGGNAGFSGDAGTASTATNPSLGLGNNGVVGGNGGGAGVNRGAAGVAGGSQLAATHGGIRHLLAQVQGRLFTASAVVSFTAWGGNAGSGGGGSGAAGTGTQGGGGGAGGGGGDAGGLLVAAQTLAGAGTIRANGGAGGAGGAGASNGAGGTAGGGGGGGGGNGGNGGWVGVIYNDNDGWTGAIQANGGAFGAGGAGGVATGGGVSGQTAPDGNAGKTGVAGSYKV